MASLTCTACNHENAPDARFCGSCGTPLGARHACTECGATLVPGARFCGSCGASTAAPEVPPGPGSFVNGVWDKGEDELVRQVSEREMVGRFFDTGTDTGTRGFWAFVRSMGRGAIDALQGRTIQIPIGCVGALTVHGEVRAILPPGRQTTVRGLWDAVFKGERGGVVDDLIDNLEGARPALYLVDRRPVPVHLQVEVPAAQPGQSLTLGVSVTAHPVTGMGDAAREALTRFLNQVVADREVLTARQLRDHVRPHVERTVRDVARTFKAGTTDLDAVTSGIAATLSNAIGKQSGLTFDVMVSPRAAIISLDLHLGQVQLPELTPCVHTACDAQVRFGAMYCPECGKRQPSRSHPDRTCRGTNDAGTLCGAQVPVGAKFCKECGTPFEETSPEAGRLISEDGELVELDLVLRAQGNRELDDPTAVEQAIADAVARLVRGMTYDELSTAQGFQKIGEALEAVAERTLRALQLTLLDVTVLDCKSKNGEWQMGARAELKRALLEQQVAREWLDVDAAQITLDGERVKLDLQKLDVEQLRLDVELRQLRMQRDMAFEVRGIERADELRNVRAETEHQRTLDEEQLIDREERQDHLNRGAELDIADAQRSATTDVALDEANRTRDRTLRDRDHKDAMGEARQAHERTTQALDHAEELEDRSDARRRTRESDELGHQMAMEDRSAEHDEKQARRAMGLESDRTRLGADTRDYVERKDRDRDLHYQREQANLNLDTQERAQDLDLKGERGRMEIDQDGKDRDHGRQKDLLQMEQDNEARERDWQLKVLQQKAEAEQARIKAEAEGKVTMNQSLAGMTPEQMAAAAMQGRALTDAEAAMLAEGLSGSGQKEMLERMLAEQQRLTGERLADKDAVQAQFVAMFQQMANQKNVDSDRMAATFQQMMQTLASNTAALAGAQQHRDQQMHQQVVAAHRDAQGQAAGMAERAMESMGQVAAARAAAEPSGSAEPAKPDKRSKAAASPGPAAAPATAPATVSCQNPDCGVELEPGTKFCTTCGTKQVV